jgi:hypothetical protein
MKLSLITAASLAATLAIGCASADDDKKATAPPPADTAPVPTETAPARQLVDGKALATTPVNLLADPGFSLAGRDSGYGSFLGFYDGGQERFTLAATLDSRSPAGFGGAVGLVRPAKATDSKSKAVTLLTAFLGGTGPFHAKIWVSKSNVNDEPLPTDDVDVKVSVADGNPESGEAFDLAADPAATRVVNGRTWVLLRGDIMKPLVSGGFFVIRTGTKGGHIHLASPEVTSDQLAVGQAVLARKDLLIAAARAKTSNERQVIRAYKSIPPRLLPAAPSPQHAD